MAVPRPAGAPGGVENVGGDLVVRPWGPTTLVRKRLPEPLEELRKKKARPAPVRCIDKVLAEVFGEPEPFSTKGPIIGRAAKVAECDERASHSTRAVAPVSTSAVTGRKPLLLRLCDGGATSLLCAVVLPFTSARDLARLEACCHDLSSPSVGGRSAVEYAAWLQLSPRPASVAAQCGVKCSHRLYFETERVRVTVLQRRARGFVGELAMRSALVFARAAASHHSVLFSSESAEDFVVRGPGPALVDAFERRTGDGDVFFDEADDGDDDTERETIELTPEDALSLRIQARGVDAALSLGECVVTRLPESVQRAATSAVRTDGCWVVRRVNGSPCWTPETYLRKVREAQLAQREAEVCDRASCGLAALVYAAHHGGDNGVAEEVSSASSSTTSTSTTSSLASTTRRRRRPGSLADNRAPLASSLSSSSSTTSSSSSSFSQPRSPLPLSVPLASAHPHNVATRTLGIRVEFERAYDQVELWPRLATTTGSVVRAAKAACGISEGTAAALFATSAAAAQRTSCWTEADPTPLTRTRLNSTHRDVTLLILEIPDNLFHHSSSCSSVSSASSLAGSDYDDADQIFLEEDELDTDDELDTSP